MKAVQSIKLNGKTLHPHRKVFKVWSEDRGIEYFDPNIHTKSSARWDYARHRNSGDTRKLYTKTHCVLTSVGDEMAFELEPRLRNLASPIQ